MDGGAVCWRNATEPSSSPALITVCVFLSALWTIFWSVLSPQLQGRVVTTCLRFFLKKTRVSVGSISLNLAAGRILFKDVFFADIDNSFRVCDGFISFPWWRRQKSHASLTGESVQYNAFVLQLNGFHYHWYNRDEAYKLMTGKYQSDSTIEDMPSRAKNSYSWHRYLPVLQCRLTKGSMMFGNSNVPTSLVVYFDSALANYSVSSATNPFDEFLHVVVFHGSNMKAYLQPSVGYSGQYELPPVSEDKGFLFAQSDSAVITYAYDVPGIVQTEQMEGPGPRLSFAIEFGSNTVVNYGPWAHRQRFFLQRLFVPHDYKDAPITELPKLGEQRITKQLDVTFYTTKGIEICLLFRDCKSISRLQLTAGRDSHISISQPWVTQEEGYTTQIYGQVWQPQFTTSLPYPQAANGKSLEINVSLHFPRKWNHKQTWTMNFSAEAVACVIMIHFVDFFDALLTDWWGQDPSDFCFFVPLEWKVKVKICSYEVFVVTNRFNWMDVSPGQSENTRLAFCGQTGELIFELPLTIFMPLEQKVHFSAAGQSLVVRRYLPPSCTTQKSVSNMAVANRQRWRFPKVLMNDASLNCATRDLFPMGVCFSTRSEDGWIDLAAGPEITIALNYISRRNDGLESKIRQGVIPLSNSVDVQVKIPDAVVRLFGFLARDLYAVKENFIGDYPFMNTFDSTKVNGVIVRSDIPEPVVPNQPSPSTSQLVDNILSQRFLDIHVDIMLLDVTADFPVHPSILNDHNCPLPSGYCSCLHLSVDYRMDGTQVMLSVEKISVLLPGKTSAEDCLGEVGCLVCPQVQITAQGYTDLRSTLSGTDSRMAEKEQTDVEMKDVSEEPKSDAEGGKEKVQEKAKDVNLLTIEDIREQLKLIEKGVLQRESRFINRALRKLLSIRKRLNDTVLRRLLMVTFPSGSTMREDLLPYLPEPMDTEETSQLRPKSSRAPPLSPESECFVHLLVLVFLIDGGGLEQAQGCAEALMEKVGQLNSRTLDLISARCFFYYARVYELRGELAGIRSVLHARLRTATLRHDEEGQAMLLNLLLRNYLHYNLFDQADKLIAKSKFPETASNNEGARYLYYTGRIKAIQLEYSEAYTRLLQAIRKAPQDSAVGFLQTTHKFAVVVQLLLGEIPERSLFREPMLRRPLEPYFQLAQAVHSGDVVRFSDVLKVSQAKFQQDKTYTLIIRLRHNVIKTGIRMISLSYSRISLADIAEKLSLESTQDAEYIVAKAIRDGVIEAVINHEEGYVQSRETADIYSTREPQDAFHQRIQFCLELHNQSVKAMRYPPKVSKADEEETKERLEREKQDIELASEIEDEDEEDGDYLP